VLARRVRETPSRVSNFQRFPRFPPDSSNDCSPLSGREEGGPLSLRSHHGARERFRVARKSANSIMRAFHFLDAHSSFALQRPSGWTVGG